MVHVRKLAMLLLLGPALPCFAQQGGDLQAQILYAFHTEDLNELADLTVSLGTQAKADGGNVSLRYHLAHAEYRYATLAAEQRPHAAERALSDCVDQLQAILDRDAQSVEALALISACYADLAGFKTVQSGFFRKRAADRLAMAYQLAPRNPRVLLLLATHELARAPHDSPERAQALARLRLAADLFERSSATSPDAPGWGDAQAYLALGRESVLQGDALGARNWIERALIAAPDYKAAQRVRAELAGH
jgi:hypothetical protein